MGRIIGKNTYIGFIHSGGTALVDSDYRTFDVGDEMGAVDLSAGADNLRTYAQTLEDVKPSAEMLYADGAAGSAIWSKVRPGTAGTLVWGWEGEAAGKPKWGIACFVTKCDMSGGYENELAISVEWANSGSDFVYNGANVHF